MRDPVTDLNRRGRAIFAGVFIFAILHSILYIITVPTWDLFDEEQHLSYALYLIDDQTLPEIDDPVQQRILDSAVATERWSQLRIGRPPTVEQNEFGLESWSYEAYHPPLYHALVSPLTLLSGDDAWRELYAARLFGIFLLFAMAGISWGYARDWLPDADPAVWGAIALSVVAIPSVAAASGRVNNDLLAGLMIAAGTLMASRLLEDRRTDQALFLGLIGAAAVLTKGQGSILLLVTLAALAILLRRRQLTASIFLLAIGPGVVGFLIWGAWTYSQYDVINSANAFVDIVGRSQSLGVADFVGELWLNSWSSYWGAYDGGSLRLITGLVLLLVSVSGAIGLFIGRDGWQSTAQHRDKLILCAVLFGGMIAALWIANDSGLAHPHGRMLLGVFPPLVTLVVAGVRRLGGDMAAVQIGALSVALSAAYFLFWYLPFFY
ncbi:MAG: glycosyltransferase family 39 protein [Thermomicrobiales bacterium]